MGYVDVDFNLLMESVKKVKESIDKSSPVEKFDVGVEFMETCLQTIKDYEQTVPEGYRDERGLNYTIHDVQIGLEEMVKLWAERHKKIRREIWEIEESCANVEFWIYCYKLLELYWSKRGTVRRRMTAIPNRKRKRTGLTPE